MATRRILKWKHETSKEFKPLKSLVNPAIMLSSKAWDKVNDKLLNELLTIKYL